MYALYERYYDGEVLKLSFEEKISLAGCRAGIVVELLRQKLTEGHTNPPIGWILPVSQHYQTINSAVVIDIKPDSDEHFLCELDTVFGYTFPTFTPLMYRLKVLYNEDADEFFDKFNFEYPREPEIIYTLTYMMGSFKDGQIIGKWQPAMFGSANSVLLWGEAMTFFVKQIQTIDPDFLTRRIVML